MRIKTLCSLFPLSFSLSSSFRALFRFESFRIMDFYFDRIAFYQRRSRRSRREACESFRGISIWNTRENLEKWSGRKYRVGIQNVLKGGQRVAGRQSFVESGALRVEHWERSIELSSAERIQQIFGKFCDGREGFYIYIYTLFEEE